MTEYQKSQNIIMSCIRSFNHVCSTYSIKTMITTLKYVQMHTNPAVCVYRQSTASAYIYLKLCAPSKFITAASTKLLESHWAAATQKVTFHPKKLPGVVGGFPNETEVRRRMFSTAEHDRVQLCASVHHSAPPQHNCSKSWRFCLGI